MYGWSIRDFFANLFNGNEYYYVRFLNYYKCPLIFTDDEEKSDMLKSRAFESRVFEKIHELYLNKPPRKTVAYQLWALQKEVLGLIDTLAGFFQALSRTEGPENLGFSIGNWAETLRWDLKDVGDSVRLVWRHIHSSTVETTEGPRRRKNENHGKD